jgi:2-dehydropantoate 2-reductase
MPMAPRIVMIGAGAVGSVVSGLLFDADHDVTIVDQWPEHVELIKHAGLKLSGTCGERTARLPALHIHELQSVTEPFDLALLAVKSYDTDWATTLTRGYLSESGTVVTLQNGINDHRVAEIVGGNRAVGCITLIGVAMDEPGAAMKTDSDPTGFKIGEHDGRETARANEIAGILSDVAGAVVTSNLWGDRWSKLALNCMVNPLAALSGFGAAEVRLDPRCQELGVRLGAEAIAVGRASGHEVEPVFGIPPQQLLDAARGDGIEAAKAQIAAGAKARGNGWPSMLQDVKKHRRTEVDYLNGHVADEGRRLGVATPYNDAVVERFAELGTTFDPDPRRLEPLAALLEEPAQV